MYIYFKVMQSLKLLQKIPYVCVANSNIIKILIQCCYEPGFSLQNDLKTHHIFFFSFFITIKRYCY